jgi:hypothetical protein
VMKWTYLQMTVSIKTSFMMNLWCISYLQNVNMETYKTTVAVYSSIVET